LPAAASDDPLVGVERLVSDQRVGLHRGQQVVGADEIMRLSAGQEEVDGVAERVGQSMDFDAQSTARSPNRLVLAGFFWHLRRADGRVQWCCRSSHTHCRHPLRGGRKSSPRHQISPIG
jgi:hypothetical protein